MNRFGMEKRVIAKTDFPHIISAITENRGI
jgi:hypothetical protein